MNWNLVIYIVASLTVAIAIGNLDYFTDIGKGYYRGFNFPVFFLTVGLLTIGGLFIFKYNTL